MARLLVENGSLVVRLRRLETLGALHRSLRVPMANVVSVEPSEDMWGTLSGLRAPGTGFSGVIALGTWRYKGGKDFVAVYQGKGVVVELAGAEWGRILVSSAAPYRLAERLNSQCQEHVR